ncbi:MAG: phosphoribosylformylglycinamidine synthase I [Ignavibacteria bacterium]|nr:phosphoribosylformylglycinamidine synthase I [Ignavibacteria bacterium]
MKPKTFILSGYGFNCEEETKIAFELSGGSAEIIHINDWIDNKNQIREYQIFAIPGGFSYGDDTGSGNAMANKIRNHCWDELLKFISEDKLVIGICNGFQVLVNLGLLPAVNGEYGKRTAAMLHNTSARYINRWVNVKTTSEKCIFTKNISQMFIPVAHGEGNFFVEVETLSHLKANEQIALRYVCEDGTNANGEFPSNPNGSLDDIAGMCDASGRVFGLMPHPERGMFFTQRPDWTLLKEKLKREEKPLPEWNDGIEIFRNAVHYF